MRFRRLADGIKAARRKRAFINIKFHGSPSATALTGTNPLTRQLRSAQLERLSYEKSSIRVSYRCHHRRNRFGDPIACRSRVAGWWLGGGWGPGLAGGLIAGAVIGGIASNAYAYGPGYGYYGGPGYGYGGGYAPAYYGGYPADYGDGYAPVYYGGYRTSYAPAYYGPRYRRVVRPAYAYGGPRYYRGHRDRW